MTLRATCLEEPEADRRVHAWESTGLDSIDGRLCSTRRCVWCGTQQHKTYGARRGSWRIGRTALPDHNPDQPHSPQPTKETGQQ